jgi:hypothetical protein
MNIFSLFILMASITSCPQPRLAPTLFIFTMLFHLHLHWVDLVSPNNIELGIHRSFTDFGVSNNIPLTLIYYWARPVTLNFGRRTMPFGYLHSAD